MPKVSIIVPVYGVEKYIERCVRSLFEQTLTDIEYIIVDDCTLDRSIDILKLLIEEYKSRLIIERKTVQIERMSNNSGLPIVRKEGASLATGEYIIHCDSDDWVDKDMYRLMYEKAKKEDADVVSCDYQVSDGVHILRSMKERWSPDRDNTIKNLMLQKSHWVLWNKMFKRSVLENTIIYPTQNMGEDMALSLQMLYYCERIAHINKPLYYYFYNEKSISNIKEEEASLRRFYQTLDNVRIIEEFYKEKQDYCLFSCCINWLRFVCKCHLNIRTEKGRQLWNTVFPYVEWKCLFYPLLSGEQRMQIIRKIAKK